MFQLANTPTPIHHWAVPGLPEGISVFIKRDDMNGSTLGGNKVCMEIYMDICLMCHSAPCLCVCDISL